MIVFSYTVCLLSPLFFTETSGGEDDSEMALSFVGQVYHEVFQRENKRQTERKLFIREHQLKCCFLFSLSISSHPSSKFLFHFIVLFPHTISFSLSLSLPTYLARYPLSSPSCLRLLPSQISSSLVWNMNILKLRSLKGTMKWPPS